MKVRKLSALLLVLLMLLSLAACGGNAPAEDNYYAAEMEKAPEAGLSKSESATTDAMSLPADRKLIRIIDISAETEDMTTLTEEVTARISALGGYVEAKNLYNGSNYAGYVRRNLTMTVRIPAEKADEFVSRIGEHSNIVSSTEHIDDVTLQYVDTESQVKALETEQTRLMELLAQAETLEDILKIEERLTNVRYELERYASRLRTLDNQVSYATINLSVTEVKEYTPVVVEEPTAWQQISQGFRRSLKDIADGLTEFFIWVVVNSPYILIWGTIAVIVILVIRRRRGKSFRRRKAAPPTENAE